MKKLFGMTALVALAFLALAAPQLTRADVDRGPGVSVARNLSK